MHTFTHCFFSQAVYIRLTLHISFMVLSVCLTKHMFVLTMQKADLDRTPLPPNTTHAFTQLPYISATILILPSTASIALIIMLLCNVS
jgi:hypothetical protein